MLGSKWHIFWIVLGAFCVPSGYLYAQSNTIDSLKLALTSEARDTHRVSLLNALVSQISLSEPIPAMAYTSEAIGLADSLGFTRGLADAKIAYAEAQNALGGLERSLDNGMQAYALYGGLRDTMGLARALNLIGLVQNKLFQFDNAEESLRKAAACYAAANDLRGQITASHNLAVVYTSKKDTAAAKVRYLENLGLLQGTNFNHIFAATYNNLGNLFDHKTQGDSALHYYEVSLQYKFMAKAPNNGSIGNSLMNISNVYLTRGALQLAEKKMNEAEYYVLLSNQKERLLELHRLKGELYYKMGRYKESAEHFEQQSIIQDSIFAPQMTDQAARLQAAFNSENQKKEIELLNQAKALDEIDKSRWQWLAGGAAVCLVLMLLVLVLVALRGREHSRMMRLLQQKGEEIKRQQQEIVLQNEALSIQNARLEGLNREKDGLIGIVAHDIRAPLNRSAALAELTASIGGLSPEQDRYLQMIKKVSEDGGRLIQDLLELNSYEQNAHRLEFANIDLALALEHSCHGFEASAKEKNIEILVDAPSTMAKTEEKLLGRILDNVISNAVKFTPKGKKIHLSIHTDADRHWISIRDEGPGISEQDQSKMFQKFQRLSARPTGGESSTGLGLSIIKALADRIGVELTFESKIGLGTTFKVGIRKTG